ncbi:MAG: hypothetical protein JSR17_06880 [Proteobacteria bacterium]|nr:hypothetical protein [Pseudomonadota bacterium]
MRTLFFHETYAVSGANLIEDILPYFDDGEELLRFMCLCGSVAGGYYGANLAYASYGLAGGIAGGIGGVLGTALLGPGALIATDYLIEHSLHFWGLTGLRSDLRDE